MIQEEKQQLLLVDICARFPYDTIISVNDGKYRKDVKLHPRYIFDWDAERWDAKPYLRPMSSMTEEEKEELKSKCIHFETEEDWEGVRSDVWGIKILDKYDTRRWDNTIWTSTVNMDAIDWLNAKHFDYRGLIDKGLALEAPEGMYKES